MTNLTSMQIIKKAEQTRQSELINKLCGAIPVRKIVTYRENYALCFEPIINLKNL